jgi:predicted heme/steroid binding protein
LIAGLGLLLLASSWGPALALPEYTERTGQPCGSCHRDPGGGGPLTPLGEAFGAGGHVWPVPEAVKGQSLSPTVRILRLVLGFVHLAAAVVWLGTIFYVHLVLRPKYALGGLPRSEVQLAWICMLLLGSTGLPLTHLRFHHPQALLATRSGNLLLLKIGLYLFLVLSAAFVTLWVGPRLRRARAGWQENDGKEGRPSWVRVGERLYDLSLSSRWKEGNHFRRHQAGSDLTAALAGAPHGAEKLDSFPSFPVPTGAASGKAAAIFYVMAYVNLFVAAGVLAVLSFWRWG